MNQQSVAKFADFPVTRHRHIGTIETNVSVCYARYVISFFSTTRIGEVEEEEAETRNKTRGATNQTDRKWWKIIKWSNVARVLNISRCWFHRRSDLDSGQTGPWEEMVHWKTRRRRGTERSSAATKRVPLGKSLRVIHFHFSLFLLPFVSLFFRCLYIFTTFTTGFFVKRFSLGYIIYVRHSHSRVTNGTSPDLR